MFNLKSKLFISICVLVSAFLWASPLSAHAGFRFVTWGDSRDTPSVFGSLSTQVKTLNPQPTFTLFNGDLCASWSSSCIQEWVNYSNGSTNNGIGSITFPVRGNHDADSGTDWSTFFNTSATATRVGATNYTALTADMTYSFDYQNAHFVGIDLPGGDVSSMSSAQITWLDNDLTAAEGRGLKMAFLYWHGPIYYIDGHSSTPSSALINVLNKHPFIMATYHGHEHIVAHVTLDSTRISTLTNKIEQFIDGTAGAPAYSCTSGRSDYCQNYNAFVVTDVISDTEFTVSVYQQGVSAPVFTRTFTKSVTPPGPSPTTSPQIADINGDHVVNFQDVLALGQAFQKTPISPAAADVDRNGTVNILDLGYVFKYFGSSY